METLKALIGIFVSLVYDWNGMLRSGKDEHRASIDIIMGAHFNASAHGKLFVELPPEDARHGNRHLRRVFAIPLRGPDTLYQIGRRIMGDL